MPMLSRRSLLVTAAASSAAVVAACSTGSSANSTSPARSGAPNVDSDPTVDRFTDQRIVPVLRDPSPEKALETARAWISAGCSTIELTTSTPDVFDAARELSDEGIYVGIGTMRNAAQVEASADAGARFVLSFATFPELIDTARERGITPIPGTMTPTEVFASLAAPIIKVFPAATVGIGYLEALQIVYPGIRTQVTGGIGATPEDSLAWLDAGATAIGVSGDVCGDPSAEGVEAVSQRISSYLAAVRAGIPNSGA